MIGLIISIGLASIILFLIIHFFTGHNTLKNRESLIKAKVDVTESPTESSVAEGQQSDHSMASRTYSSLSDWEKDTKVLWRMDKNPLELGFTYEKWDRFGEKYVREQRSVNMEEIIKDSRNDFYLRGNCLARGDLRTFHLERISSKIMYKNRQYDPFEFIEKFDVV
jgi:hypothetical protein